MTKVLSPNDSSSSGVGGNGRLGAPPDVGAELVALGLEVHGVPSATDPNPGL